MSKIDMRWMDSRQHERRMDHTAYRRGDAYREWKDRVPTAQPWTMRIRDREESGRRAHWPGSKGSKANGCSRAAALRGLSVRSTNPSAHRRPSPTSAEPPVRRCVNKPTEDDEKREEKPSGFSTHTHQTPADANHSKYVQTSDRIIAAELWANPPAGSSAEPEPHRRRGDFWFAALPITRCCRLLMCYHGMPRRRE